MVSQVTAAPQAANQGAFISKTCSKIAGFISRNRWLLLGACIMSGVMVGAYLLYRYSVTPTANNVPKCIVTKAFKWTDLHPATKIDAVMSRFDDVQKNIDQADLEQVVKKEFKPCKYTFSGKNTTALTLLIMLEPKRLNEHLQGEYHSDYLVKALADYLRHAKDGLFQVLNILKNSNKQDLLIQALINSKKLDEAYNAEHAAKEIIIKTVDSSAFSALYKRLDNKTQKDAIRRLIDLYLNQSLKLDLKELLQQDQEIKEAVIIPLTATVQSMKLEDLAQNASKLQALSSVYPMKFDPPDIQVLNWVFMPASSSPKELFELHKALPEAGQKKLLACLTETQRQALQTKLSPYIAYAKSIYFTIFNV